MLSFSLLLLGWYSDLQRTCLIYSGGEKRKGQYGLSLKRPKYRQSTISVYINGNFIQFCSPKLWNTSLIYKLNFHSSKFFKILLIFTFYLADSLDPLLPPLQIKNFKLYPFDCTIQNIIIIDLNPT